MQTLGASEAASGIQGFEQTIARGPVAGQIAIKQLGTNGGGFFNVNSAHPFEGGTGAFGNFVGMFSILLIPAALTYTFGRWVGNVRQGWALFAVMMVLFIGGLALTVPQERSASQAMVSSGVSASAENLEGKELRIGVDESTVWAVATTAASNGSVNSMHDSYRPLGQLAPMFNMGIGEVVWGGVGSGLYGMIFYAVIAVFIGGLMVGRTPEYLGKKIGAREVKTLGDRGPRPVHPGPRVGRRRGRDPGRYGSEGQPRTARVQRDLLRVPVHGEQQRVGLRRDHRERAVLHDLGGLLMLAVASCR